MTDVTDVYGLDLMDDHEDSELLDDELKEVLSDEILVL